MANLLLPLSLSLVLMGMLATAEGQTINPTVLGLQPPGPIANADTMSDAMENVMEAMADSHMSSEDMFKVFMDMGIWRQLFQTNQALMPWAFPPMDRK